MILKRFYDEALAQASYLVGCAMTGEALVVDPNRDVDTYTAAAAAEGLRITHVTETHIHADFVSGLRELVARTGARPYLSGEGGNDWQYTFANEIDAVVLRDGATWKVGNVRVAAVHTPGHTPEHMCYVITDTAGADQPMGVFTGDFIFAGDVGRPDLLEKAAGIGGTMEAAARQLFASLQTFRERQDWLQLWPGHGAGSACGKSLGAVPSTTLGYEKLFNWAFSQREQDEFVATVLAGQPEPPKYFAEMKRVNRAGPRLLGGLPSPAPHDASALADLVRGGALVIDARPWQQYRQGYVPGTINIPHNKSFTTWSGWLVPYDRDFHIIVADAAAARRAARDLAMIGLDRMAGFFDASAIETYARNAPLARIEEMTPEELDAKLRSGAVNVLDVRGRSEWEAGHLPGIANIPLGYLTDHIDEIPADRPLVLHCRGGGRSAIAASVLAAHGVPNVINLTGGFDRWAREGHAVERAANDQGVAAAR
jgi:hydroxyacylglutathione hydrolase